jgi:autotransporter-associated beta strand protein
MHSWGFEWSPAYMGLSKDGAIRNSIPTAYTIAKPLFMIFSGGVVINGAGGGSLSSQTFPADFTIDYVRVYKRAEHLYNGDFAFGKAAAWTLANSSTTVSSTAGPSGGSALVLGNGTDARSRGSATQKVSGLIPGARYWVAAKLKATGGSAYLGVSGEDGGITEAATTSGSYTDVSLEFVNGPRGATADVYARLDAGAGRAGNAAGVRIRREEAISDPGFELNDLSLYWDESYGGRSVDSTNARGGKRCLSLTTNRSAAQQTIHGLRPNTTYQLTGWINSGGVNCYLGAKDFGGTVVSQAVNSTSYTQATVTFTTGPSSTTARVYVWLPTLGASPAYADDLFLARSLASPWQQADVGSVGLAGASGQWGGGFVIRGAGSDIWGTADSFRFVSQSVVGDCRIVARVLKVDPTDRAAKVGIMLRDGTSAGARHIEIAWTPDQKVESLWRATANGSTASQTASDRVTSAPWVRIERVGNNFTTAWSPDGIHWTNVTTQALDLPTTLSAGLVVCAHDSSQLNEGVLGEVSVGSYTARAADDLTWNGGSTWLNRFGDSVAWDNTLADGATFGATGAGAVNLSSATTLRGLTFNATGYTLSGAPLTLVGSSAIAANAAAAISSVITGSAGLNKTGSDVLTLSGANTYTGGTTITAGTLKLSGGGTLGAITSSVTAAGGTLDLGGTTQTAGVATISGGAITNGTLVATAFDGRSGEVGASLSGANATLTKTNSGTLALSGANTYSGGTVLNAGTLSVASSAALGGNANPLTFSGGLLRITGTTLANLDSRAINWKTFKGGFDIADARHTFTISTAIGGASLTKAGAGTLKLTGVNTYTSDTIINGGTLAVGGSGRLYASGGGRILINTGGVLSVSGDIGYVSRALGSLDMAGASLVFDGGTFRHTGASNAKSGQPGAGRLFMLVEGGGTLESATAGQKFTLGYRTDFGSDILSPVGGTLTLAGAGDGDLNYGLGGAGGLIKTGAGTWKLTGSSYTLTGPTIVSQGALLVRGTISNSAVTVASGGTLGGSGTLAQLVTVQAGGALAPGDNAIGTLTASGGLTLNAGCRLAFEIGSTADRIAVSGAYTAPASGSVRVDVTGLAGFGEGSYPLITGASGISASSFALGSAPSGHVYRFVANGGTLSLVVDGIQAWRLEHFGTTSNSGDAADSADPDGDGMTNAQEFASGTNPRDSASLLKVSVLTIGGVDIQVSFPSVLGKTYRVERSDTLQTGSWTMLQEIAGTGGVLQITDAGAAAQAKRIYRIVIIP